MDTKAWLILAAAVVLLTMGVAAVLLVRVIRARRLLLDARIPLGNKALVWAAVIYTVSPIDLLPDPVYLDDIGFLLLALRSVHVAARNAYPLVAGRPAVRHLAGRQAFGHQPPGAAAGRGRGER
ncbi:YkvA family protein [Streptomyces sp. NBC_01474]|uniref:YkvA family protein n=1 Tax=Streptomyces sp. NBC_01474 TaxID=2903880 RepID=UPI002DD983CC|nr:YkvA family protein [Streptomyces sp. NBC_01474]WSD94219.1 YkvA family protein [Streptomyces sp. NBC_01474]